VTNPIRERPMAPAAYGYSKGRKGMMDWSDVEAALAAAPVYFLSTISPDGSSHTTPIWGAWVGHHLYFEGGTDTRWSKNLGKDHRMSFGADSKGLHISGKGIVVSRPAAEAFNDVKANYASKYEYQPTSDDFRVFSPTVVIALNFTSLENFAQTPTKFRFSA
jgi:hypothetical protein